MSDNRAISRTLFEKLLDEKGVYYPFYDFVRSHEKELVLCFRGNGNPESIVIYHNNHIVWELYGDEDKIGISFNHARYNENWNKIEESLFQWGFDKNGRDEKALVPNRVLH